MAPLYARMKMKLGDGDKTLKLEDNELKKIER